MSGVGKERVASGDPLGLDGVSARTQSMYFEVRAAETRSCRASRGTRFGYVPASAPMRNTYLTIKRSNVEDADGEPKFT